MHNVKCASQSHFPFAHCVAYDLWHYSFTIELIFAFKSRCFFMTTTMPILSPSFTFLRLNWIDSKKIIFASNLGSFFSESLIHTGNLYFECKFTAWWQCDEFSFYLSIIGFIACERDHNCTWILPDCLIATMTVKFHFGKL